jgi:hypothetical protein
MSADRFDRLLSWVYAVCCTIFVGGLYLDGWSHQYLFEQIDTFFNPWHAVLYAGYAITAMTLMVWTLKRRTTERSWWQAIAPGHLLSAWGVFFFLLGGNADMVWHEVLGFEKGIEGLVSPSHFILALGMALMVSGGMRHWFATHRRDEYLTFLESVPLLLSMLCLLAQWTFLTQYGRYTDFNATGPLPTDQTFISCTQSISLLGVLLFSIMLAGLFTFVIRRARLPFGSVTLVLTVQVFGLGMMRFGAEHVWAAVGAGLAGDLILHFLSPHWNRRSLLLFCCIVPAVFYTGVFATLHANAGLWWSLHLWSGVPFLAGAAGLFAGILGSPVPEETLNG